MSRRGRLSGPAVDRLIAWTLALAAGLPRLWALDLRPLHHDEGSNAIFVLRLAREGIYQYDPANYHGPTLYYLGAGALRLLGTSTVALRLVPALLGTALAPLAWALRREIGRPGAAAAALFVAFSPSCVYYSRDAIHEMVLVFLTLLLVVALVRALRSERLVDDLLAGGAAGAIIATKETFPLAIGSVLAGMILSGTEARALFRPKRIAGAMAAALFVAGAFYSHGFTDPAGLLSPVQALRIWGARAEAGEGHRKPWWYFLMLLAREEAPIVAAAIAGTVAAARRRQGLGIWAAVWGATTLVAYSAIPYKTPWLVLNVVLPLALLGGVGVQAGLERIRSPAARARLTVVVALGLLLSLGQAVRISFLRFDDDSIPLVYVQTRRDALRLVARIEEVASRDPEGRALSIQILSPDYLPLNWYLRDFTRVAYFGHPIDHPEGPIVIARSDSADQVARLLGPGYRREEHDLRPGVRLVLFVREERESG